MLDRVVRVGVGTVTLDGHCGRGDVVLSTEVVMTVNCRVVTCVVGACPLFAAVNKRHGALGPTSLPFTVSTRSGL